MEAFFQKKMTELTAEMCQEENVKNLRDFSRGDYIIKIRLADTDFKHVGFVYQVLFATTDYAQLHLIGRYTDKYMGPVKMSDKMKIETITDSKYFPGWAYVRDLNDPFFASISGLLSL